MGHLLISFRIVLVLLLRVSYSGMESHARARPPLPPTPSSPHPGSGVFRDRLRFGGNRQIGGTLRGVSRLECMAAATEYQEDQQGVLYQPSEQRCFILSSYAWKTGDNSGADAYEMWEWVHSNFVTAFLPGTGTKYNTSKSRRMAILYRQTARQCSDAASILGAAG